MADCTKFTDYQSMICRCSTTSKFCSVSFNELSSKLSSSDGVLAVAYGPTKSISYIGLKQNSFQGLEIKPEDIIKISNCAIVKIQSEYDSPPDITQYPITLYCGGRDDNGPYDKLQSLLNQYAHWYTCYDLTKSAAVATGLLAGLLTQKRIPNSIRNIECKNATCSGQKSEQEFVCCDQMTDNNNKKWLVPSVWIGQLKFSDMYYYSRNMLLRSQHLISAMDKLTPTAGKPISMCENVNDVKQSSKVAYELIKQASVVTFTDGLVNLLSKDAYSDCISDDDLYEGGGRDPDGNDCDCFPEHREDASGSLSSEEVDKAQFNSIDSNSTCKFVFVSKTKGLFLFEATIKNVAVDSNGNTVNKGALTEGGCQEISGDWIDCCGVTVCNPAQYICDSPTTPDGDSASVRSEVSRISKIGQFGEPISDCNLTKFEFDLGTIVLGPQNASSPIYVYPDTNAQPNTEDLRKALEDGGYWDYGDYD